MAIIRIRLPVIFEDENGNQFTAVTFEEFEEYMGRADLHIVFK